MSMRPNAITQFGENLHQVLASDLCDLAVLEELAVVVESHQNTSGRPRELVAEGIVGGLKRLSACVDE